MTTVKVEIEGRVARVTLNRPEVRNAFNPALMEELSRAFASLPEGVGVVVLTGEGSTFCSGADIKWMKESAKLQDGKNAADAAQMVDVFRAIDEAPQLVICRLQGPALGGGMGLVACCDFVIASENVMLGFPEVRLGLLPAVISPFVLRKISISNARRYFATGEFFDTQTAARIGLVHEVVPADQLDSKVEEVVQSVVGNAPVAMGQAKGLIREVLSREPDDAMRYAVETIARLRASPEGQEGLASFLEKRPPKWTQ